MKQVNHYSDMDLSELDAEMKRVRAVLRESNDIDERIRCRNALGEMTSIFRRKQAALQEGNEVRLPVGIDRLVGAIRTTYAPGDIARLVVILGS